MENIAEQEVTIPVEETSNGTGFRRSLLSNVVEVKVSLPGIFPSTLKKPFVLYMRLQSVKEAQDATTQFLALDDEEQEAAMHEYDAKMISTLSVKAPTGFTDFPSVANETPNALKIALYDYFLYQEGSDEEREGMAFLCRTLMSRYRRIVNPSDYL